MLLFPCQYIIFYRLNGGVDVKSVQNSLVDFNYFQLKIANRFISKVINAISCVIYY